MNIVLFLAPMSLFLALGGLGAFWWTVKSGQYDDPLGDAARVLDDRYDDSPDGAPRAAPGGVP
jgi:cbb3-type cytochrome oxidase maturation protein